MGQSHVKRRHRERVIKRHRGAVTHALQVVCDDLGATPSLEQRRELIDEVVRLASPFAFSGIDVVLPAGRTDLIRTWFFYRLTGIVDTAPDVQRLARSLAPAPDDDFRPSLRRFGDPASAEVAAAYASRQRRRIPREEVAPDS